MDDLSLDISGLPQAGLSPADPPPTQAPRMVRLAGAGGVYCNFCERPATHATQRRPERGGPVSILLCHDCAKKYAVVLPYWDVAERAMKASRSDRIVHVRAHYRSLPLRTVDLFRMLAEELSSVQSQEEILQGLSRVAARIQDRRIAYADRKALPR